MDIFDTATSLAPTTRSVPDRWRQVSALAEFRELSEIVDCIERLDERSDRVLEALLSIPDGDGVSTAVVLAGLRRLMFLCRGRERDLLNDLVTEVAVAVGEMRRVRPTLGRRRLGYLIVDRARDRQRLARRRQWKTSSVDPSLVAEVVPALGPSVEEQVIERCRVEVLRAQVEASGNVALARSWNSLLDLETAPRSTQAERDRWKYVRRRLVEHLDPDAA